MADQYRILKEIEHADPDGWEHKEPTGEDIAKWRMWVINTYGKEMYLRYLAGNFEPQSDI